MRQHGDPWGIERSRSTMRTCVRDRSRLAYMRFRRALDRGNVMEALSAASELDFVGLAEALELTLLLAKGDLEKYNRAVLRWHVRFIEETKNVDLRESLAVLALLAAIPANRLAASALAELLSRRRSCERIAEALVRWSRGGVELGYPYGARQRTPLPAQTPARRRRSAARAEVLKATSAALLHPARRRILVPSRTY